MANLSNPVAGWEHVTFVDETMVLTRPARALNLKGCWTCRLRRKKCDEQHDDGDSCETCNRLQIKCLGWGAARPLWMKDKEAVDKYKAELKAQLACVPGARQRGSKKAGTGVEGTLLSDTAVEEGSSVSQSVSDETPPPVVFSFPERTPAEHIEYYFSTVVQLHYPFADRMLGEITHSFVTADPTGALANTICAISALHYDRTEGLGDLLAQRYYNIAWGQLCSGTGRYGEKDALAAVHLVGFSALSGETNDWPDVLNVALAWLDQTGLARDSSPSLSLKYMSPASRLALKMTLWLDICASALLMRSPANLTLYRHLLDPKRDSTLCGDRSCWLGMELICGIPEDVLLGVAGTTDLAYGPSRTTVPAQDAFQTACDIALCMRSTKVDMMMMFVENIYPSPATRAVYREIHREYASMFLASILIVDHNDSEPTRAPVQAIIRALQKVPPNSHLDRCISLAITFAASKTSDPAERAFLHSRIPSNYVFGCGTVLRGLVEKAWMRRDTHCVESCRDVLRDGGWHVLAI